MKHIGIKRIFSAALTVVLAVGLMPLPAFAETGSGQQEDMPLAAVGSAALASGPEMTAQSYYSDQKEITGLGTGAISNPKFANGGWNKVYFGSNEDSGEAPLLFNVLNTHETCFGGDTMFLDCTKIVKNMAPSTYGNEYFKSKIHKQYLNGEFLEQRFTGPEQDAIAYSVKGSQAPGDGLGWIGTNGGSKSPFCPIDWRDYARIFILDAHEATNESYGFTNPGKTTKFYSDSFTRAKTGTSSTWWTRSKLADSGYYYVTVLPSGQFSYQKYTGPAEGAYGVSPCLNVKLSSILYTSQVDTDTYKLTVKDNDIKLNVGDANKDFSYVSVPYTITGNYSKLRILLTDAEWTDSGWSNPDSEFVYMTVNESVEKWDEYSTTGTCSFKSEVLDDHPGCNVYLIAELQNGDLETDFASAPVKLTVKQGIYRIANGYTGTYDGKPHGISVDVTFPGSGATVKYGTVEGTYNLNASPTITNVADSPRKVYYQITADGYFTVTGSETVTILPANPDIPTGVTAYYGEELGKASLPAGWTWDDATSGVGGLGARTFPASYKPTSSNYKPMSGVAVPVTVVERNHNWGNASYTWSSDNKSVTAKHSCSVCGIDETETVSTDSVVTVQPTCSAMGKTSYTAEFANEAFATQTKENVEDIPIDHDAHSWGEWTQTEAPTCEETGTEERVCALNETHKEVRTVDALGHDWIESGWAVGEGIIWHMKRECIRDGCGTVVEWEYKTAEGHVHDLDLVQHEDATCVSPGTIEHYQCKECKHRFTSLAHDEELTEGQVRIAPLGHNMGEWTQAKAPTCSAAGESERTCTHEGCTYKETRIDAINPYAHEWGEWIQTTAPTCTKAGEDTYVCAHNPEHTEKRVGAAATGHTWGEPVYTWVDDNSSVTATHTCTRANCSASEIETAAVTSTVTQEPTCSSKGTTTYTATFNTEGFAAQSKSIEIAVDSEAHEWGGWVTTAYPTCTQTGTEERACAHNSSHKESREIAADPEAHEWSDWTVTKYPTCTQTGTEERVCAHDSSHKETREVSVDPEAHEWGEWTVTKAATETEEGQEQRTCSHCEETETRAIPKVDSEKPAYRNVDGDGASWTKGSGDVLVLTFKRSPDDGRTFGLFMGIEVDGAAVSKANSSGAANYIAESGSLVLKLQPTFLESLSVGGHELKALFEDGDVAATFTVKAATSKQESGDTSTDDPASDSPSKQGSSDEGANAKDANGTTATKASGAKSSAAKTGDTIPVFAIVTVAVLAALVIAAAMAARSKRKS